MNKCSDMSKDEGLKLLNEIVLDHLGIPRPYATQSIKIIQDEIMPRFIDSSRATWMATRSNTIDNVALTEYVSNAAESSITDFSLLNNILFDMGIHPMLSEVAQSRAMDMLGEIELDPYEERLLKASGHPNPSNSVVDYLCRAVLMKEKLSDSENVINEAEQISLQVHGDLNLIINTSDTTGISDVVTDVNSLKRSKYKIFSGLGKLFSGAVLVGGNAIVVPTITFGAASSLPVLGSFASGVSAIADGVEHLRKESVPG